MRTREYKSNQIEKTSKFSCVNRERVLLKYPYDKTRSLHFILSSLIYEADVFIGNSEICEICWILVDGMNGDFEFLSLEREALFLGGLVISIHWSL